MSNVSAQQKSPRISLASSSPLLLPLEGRSSSAIDMKGDCKDSITNSACAEVQQSLGQLLRRTRKYHESNTRNPSLNDITRLNKPNTISETPISFEDGRLILPKVEYLVGTDRYRVLVKELRRKLSRSKRIIQHLRTAKEIQRREREKLLEMTNELLQEKDSNIAAMKKTLNSVNEVGRKKIVQLQTSLKEAKHTLESTTIELQRLLDSKGTRKVNHSGDIHDKMRLTDAENGSSVEVLKLQNELAELRYTIAAKGNRYLDHEFVHKNLCAAPLILAPRVSIAPRRGRPPRKVRPAVHDLRPGMWEDVSQDDKEDQDEGTNQEGKETQPTDNDDEGNQTVIELTRNERTLLKFDQMIGLPKNPIPQRVDGLLAFRDGTRVTLPRPLKS